jgi:hypothetical protein
MIKFSADAQSIKINYVIIVLEYVTTRDERQDIVLCVAAKFYTVKMCHMKDKWTSK